MHEARTRLTTKSGQYAKPAGRIYRLAVILRWAIRAKNHPPENSQASPHRTQQILDSPGLLIATMSPEQHPNILHDEHEVHGVGGT
jgi:hypothetical protein